MKYIRHNYGDEDRNLFIKSDGEVIEIGVTIQNGISGAFTLIKQQAVIVAIDLLRFCGYQVTVGEDGVITAKSKVKL